MNAPHLDPAHLETAQRCLRAAHDGSLSFPEIVGTLIAAGFEGYQVDWRLGTQTFYLPGDKAQPGTKEPGTKAEPGPADERVDEPADEPGGVTLALPSSKASSGASSAASSGPSSASPSGPPVAARFDARSLEALVRWAQAAGPDYSYAAFSEKAKACGCAGYLVSFPGRRVVYYGRSGETHVEHFPQK